MNTVTVGCNESRDNVVPTTLADQLVACGRAKEQVMNLAQTVDSRKKYKCTAKDIYLMLNDSWVHDSEDQNAAFEQCKRRGMVKTNNSYGSVQKLYAIHKSMHPCAMKIITAVDELLSESESVEVKWQEIFTTVDGTKLDVPFPSAQLGWHRLNQSDSVFANALSRMYPGVFKGLPTAKNIPNPTQVPPPPYIHTHTHTLTHTDSHTHTHTNQRTAFQK